MLLSHMFKKKESDPFSHTSYPPLNVEINCHRILEVKDELDLCLKDGSIKICRSMIDLEFRDFLSPMTGS